jgi:phosphate transport system protein
LKALLRRDDELARRTREEEEAIDQLEIEIDELTLQLLTQRPELATVRLLAVAMKIAHDLERVGDEATTISRRCLELAREPQLSEAERLLPLGRRALDMLKDALDSFVRREPNLARAVIPRDEEVDEMTRRLRTELVARMSSDPSSIPSALNLIVVGKSLERVGDHATNIAEMVVYLYEGRDIRHASVEESPR